MSVAGNTNVIGALARQLKARGDTNSSITIHRQSEPEPLVKVAEPTVDDLTLFQQANVSLSEVARAKGAELEGRAFEGRYLMKGLMLANGGAGASPAQIKSREDARTLAMGAPDDELDNVARRTAERYGGYVNRETRMRVEQMIANDPATYHARLHGPNVDREKAMEKITADFKKLDFLEQKRRSRTKTGDVMLPDVERNEMNALRRGYMMISEIMRDRGLTPSVTLNGDLSAQAQRQSEKPAQRTVAGGFAGRFSGGGRGID